MGALAPALQPAVFWSGFISGGCVASAVIMVVAGWLAYRRDYGEGRHR